ncbi:DUF2268 domain-containing protein [Ureibacillus aquaedulcis]|uniref:DUF2268 domain-containing putative Zn-dependent protease n=1 Tax=Ureibacillus aquaedulcis TaxID=3058421 RepID=A0ABT8GV80_9BACL|nr:DUF2268 domain-containing putative Zn-dependent protease [Ureibacillus sp. BA0131]MDN4495271.1 DUF2268 domain-containing putative Zn-dependent protease [Ureibacillus sp. BA0131]
MAVVHTLPVLYRLNERLKEQGERKVEIHRDMICDSLKEFFPEFTAEEIQEELLSRGLFDPDEGATISETLMGLEDKKVWKIVQHELNHLKQLWNGPDIPIFIFPLTKHRPIVDGAKVKKNGVSYNNVLFLFVCEELEIVELQALLAHEYHHICRLSYLDKSPQEIDLLDTLIIEGMAEFAVEELYGERSLSPWTKGYSQEECSNLWIKYFARAIHVKDVDNHFPFLYGNEVVGLPKWIGYCIGYRIVRSYIENGGTTDHLLLSRTPSYKILEGSLFKGL